MATFFKITHSNGVSVILNMDQLIYLKKEDLKLSFFMVNKLYEVVYEKEEDIKMIYDKIFDLSEHIVREDNNDDDDDDYIKPNKEVILSERIDQLLDLLSEKDKEIKELKNEKKGFINKIKNFVQ